MKLFWKERRAGQRLILLSDDNEETEVGAVRRTPRGFDALANTNTYDPGRAQKGFSTIEEAKAFVEEFHPWDIFGGDMDMEVEAEVRPAPGASSDAGPEEAPAQPVASGSPAALVAEEVAQPATVEPTSQPRDELPQPTPREASPEAVSAPAEETAQSEDQPKKQGWRFWKRD